MRTKERPIKTDEKEEAYIIWWRWIRYSNSKEDDEEERLPSFLFLPEEERKWENTIEEDANDGDEDEDEGIDKSKGLGLSYSSSDGEDMFENSDRVSRPDLGLETSLAAANDNSMDEERRYSWNLYSIQQ